MNDWMCGLKPFLHRNIYLARFDRQIKRLDVPVRNTQISETLEPWGFLRNPKQRSEGRN